jgi:hypothetical protein
VGKVTTKTPEEPKQKSLCNLYDLETLPENSTTEVAQQADGALDFFRTGLTSASTVVALTVTKAGTHLLAQLT